MKAAVALALSLCGFVAACREAASQPPPPPPEKQHHYKCGGERETTAILYGRSYEHHVANPRDVWTRYPFTPDFVNNCSRDWCIDNKVPGLYFTHHGSTATLKWKTRCVPSQSPTTPCVAQIFDHEVVPGSLQAFHDPGGESQHWHVRFVVPDWGQSCTFIGTAPNIEAQYRCNATPSVEAQPNGDHIAYALAYSASHSSNIPVGFSAGVIAGPVFGAASYSPQFGSAMYGGSMLWESLMGCSVQETQELETMVVDFYGPVHVRTEKRKTTAFNQTGEFPPPDIR